MQVKELIEMLQEMNPEADVHFAYNYGDHWRTEVAPKLSRVDNGAVVYSDYHRMDKMLERVRTAAHGKSTQQKKVSADKVLPA